MDLGSHGLKNVVRRGGKIGARGRQNKNDEVMRWEEGDGGGHREVAYRMSGGLGSGRITQDEVGKELD